MHQPRPFGLFGRVSSQEDLAAIDALARQLTNIKGVGGLDALKIVRTLPSGDAAIALNMGGVFKVIVQNSEPVEAPEVDSDGLAKLDVPVFFSGVVKSPIVLRDAGVELSLTEDCQRRLVSYAKDKKALGSVTLKRFSIPYSELHSEFEPEGGGGAYLHTQYTKLRPTWYSGAMAALVQIAGGYGVHDFKDLPENDLERSLLKLPESLSLAIGKKLGNVRLPGYAGIPPKSGQIQFDYKFQNTHAVAFDVSGKPWLARIYQRGVYAMPLPMVPATTTPQFRQFAEEHADGELLWALDKFGGVPSGEGFPATTELFEAWRRAGAIVKVCDAGDFYSHIGFSTACGWSFNSRGNEGVNTCYSFGEDGLQVSYLYQVSLNLGAAVNDGRLPAGFDLEDPSEMRVLNAYLSALYEAMGKDKRHLATKYKLRAVPVGDVLSRAKAAVFTNASPIAELGYWDNLEAPPIATHVGSVVQIGKGTIWAPGKPSVQPQIKFPEPATGGCLSHDFGRLEGHPAPSPEPRCDAVMFAYYQKDDLKVVKYFREPRKFFWQGEDNYEECMSVGAWSGVENSSDSSIMGNFYTTDLDDRKSAAPVFTTHELTGKDLGYDTTPLFQFDNFFSMVGTMWRNRWFLRNSSSVRTENYSLQTAICIPFLHRNADLHALRESNSGVTTTKSQTLYAVRDPNSYRYWTYDFVYAWANGSSGGNVASIAKLSCEPQPKDGNPVWVTGYNYDPYPCSDFADQGDWVGGLPADYRWLIHPNKGAWLDSGGGSRPSVKEYSKTDVAEGAQSSNLKLTILETPLAFKNEPRLDYFMVSPSEFFGDVFYVDAIDNRAGDAVYVSCSEPDIDAPGMRKRWGFTRMADHKSAHHFIGVINE